jgi:hypothetical protein
MKAGDRGVVFTLCPSAGLYMANKAGKTAEQVAAEFVGVFTKRSDKPVEPTPQDLEPTCSWVMIGLRAECDQAQNRGILRPAVLGLEVPASAVERKGNGLRSRDHGAIFKTPVFEFETNAGFPAGGRAIIVNLHWVTSLGPVELEGSTVCYRLREAAMNAMGSGVSNYSSRPGIINFNEGYHWK